MWKEEVANTITDAVCSWTTVERRIDMFGRGKVGSALWQNTQKGKLLKTAELRRSTNSMKTQRKEQAG